MINQANQLNDNNPDSALNQAIREKIEQRAEIEEEGRRNDVLIERLGQQVEEYDNILAQGNTPSHQFASTIKNNFEVVDDAETSLSLAALRAGEDTTQQNAERIEKPEYAHTLVRAAEIAEIAEIADNT